MSRPPKSSRPFRRSKTGANPLAFWPDGKWIAASWPGEMPIIDLATYNEVVIGIPPIEKQAEE